MIDQSERKEGDYKKFEDARWSAHRQGVVFRHTAALALLKEAGAQTYLDVGCGDGLFEEYVQRSNPSIKGTGVDLSRTAIEKAKERVPSGSFIEADVIADGIPEGEMHDAVVALDVLEHTFLPEQLLESMRESSRRYLIVGVPNFSSLPARLQMLVGRIPENNEPKKGHAFWFNYGVLRRMLNAHNLRIVDARMNCQLERVPLIGSFMRFLTRMFPGLFALSFVVLAEKVDRQSLE